MAPFALLIGRLHDVDPRQQGERNPGAWNIWHLAGACAGMATLLLDAGKGAMAAGAGRRRAGWWAGLAGTLGAMAGHAWPAWSGFRRGGRSVAVFVGAGTILAPRPALVGWTICLATLPFGRPRASVGAGLLAYPLCVGVFGPHRRRLAGIGLAYLILLARARSRRR
jgi:glycerol-3-phosphate acyltransferase PlsY